MPTRSYKRVAPVSESASTWRSQPRFPRRKSASKRVPQERLSYASAPVGTSDTEEVDIPARRILNGVLLRSEVAREFLSVPGEEPQLGVEEASGTLSPARGGSFCTPPSSASLAPDGVGLGRDEVTS